MAETVVRAPQQSGAPPEKDGKYLTFALAHEEYGLEILKVRDRAEGCKQSHWSFR